jgi:filamentous hemagglutinin
MMIKRGTLKKSYASDCIRFFYSLFLMILLYMVGTVEVLANVNLTTISAINVLASGAGGVEKSRAGLSSIEGSVISVGGTPTVIERKAVPSSAPGGEVVITDNSEVSLPGSSLFNKNVSASAKVLVETDERFTNHRRYVNSDYYLAQLGLDPEASLKRLGDGFYEQQVVNQQIIALTGQKYLSGYHSTEAEYQTLMDNGVAFAKEYNIAPGVKLSAAQMQNLTTDVVLLTEKEVTLSSGEKQTVLMPQVYLRRPQNGDLQANGSLIAGSEVTLIGTENITNSGRINASNTMSVSAGDDIVNRGGVINGRSTVLSAGRDIQDVSGLLVGTDTLTATAGRDIVLQAETNNSSNANGTRTTVGRIATVQGGNINLTAVRDVVLEAGNITATNAATLSAGRNIEVSALQAQSQINVNTGGSFAGRTGFVKESSVSNIGSEIKAGNNVQLTAGEKLSITGSNITAGQDVTFNANQITVEAVKDSNMVDVQSIGKRNYTRGMVSTETATGGNITAGNNISMQAVDKVNLTGANVTATAGAVDVLANNDVTLKNITTNQATENEFYAKRSGLLSSSQTIQTSHSQSQGVAASTVSGNTVNVTSGNNVSVTGSNVVSTAGTSINAGNNVTIESAQAQSSGRSFYSHKESGLLMGDGLSLTLGNQKQQEKNSNVATINVASTVGSTEGNVTMNANNQNQWGQTRLIFGKFFRIMRFSS